MKKIIKFSFFILYSVFLFFIGVVCIVRKGGFIIIEKQKDLEKNHKLFSIVTVWMMKKQQGKNMITYLKKNAYHSVAIYGLGNVGRLLEEELKNDVKICYGIDRRKISAEFPVYSPEDDLPEVDIVIVTAICEFEEIEEMLKGKLSCPIYSIEDIIFLMD